MFLSNFYCNIFVGDFAVTQLDEKKKVTKAWSVFLLVFVA